MTTTLVYSFLCHTTQYGDSALMRAAWHGYAEVLVELVKAGANKDLQDNVCIYVHVHLCH